MTPYRLETGANGQRAIILGPESVMITVRGFRHADTIAGVIASHLNGVQEERAASEEEENIRFPMADELSEK